jgi:hypothetical protein
MRGSTMQGRTATTVSVSTARQWLTKPDTSCHLLTIPAVGCHIQPCHFLEKELFVIDFTVNY